MIYEQRVYTTIPGRMPNLLARFENHTLKIWERHGIKIIYEEYLLIPAGRDGERSRQVGFWTTVVGPNCGNELTYLLVWESLADREKKWDAFYSDPAWQEARANSEKDGPINQCVANSFLMPTKFSAMQ